VRLGGISGLQPEQGSSDVEATRGAKPETTAGTSELQQSAFLVGAAAAAAADIAAAAFQQLFPLLRLSSSFSSFAFYRSCAVKSKQFILQYNLGILIPYSNEFVFLPFLCVFICLFIIIPIYCGYE